MPFLSHFKNVSPESLDLLQRMLLSTDGTITDALEAAFLEPVGIVKLAATAGPATAAIEPLAIAAGDEVLHRRVRLVGQRTGRAYAYAESHLALDRLPPAFRKALLDTDTPMGRLWLEHRLETLKEFLTASRRMMGDLAVHFGQSPSDELLWRSYRLICNRQPLMVIEEYFPAVMPPVPPPTCSAGSGAP